MSKQNVQLSQNNSKYLTNFAQHIHHGGIFTKYVVHSTSYVSVSRYIGYNIFGSNMYVMQPKYFLPISYLSVYLIDEQDAARRCYLDKEMPRMYHVLLQQQARNTFGNYFFFMNGEECGCLA